MPNLITRRKTTAPSRQHLAKAVLQGAVAAIAVAVVAPEGWAGNDAHKDKRIPFEDSAIIIEFNSTDEDVGVQFFIDAEDWKSVQIFNPRGKQIFEATATGKLLRQGGASELFLESVEPTLDELPLEEFFRNFPEGIYRFVGRTAGGDKLFGSSRFTHDIPAGPQIVTPSLPAEGCAQNVPLPAVIAWNPVTTSIDGDPLDVEEYEVIVGEPAFDVHLSGTMVTVPSELLEPGTQYGFEVLAIEEGGNQTITEGCFVTAD
ncbi:MAG TPA: hypothetical protein VLB75_09340 [Steroidobacteraceae bacterium]|nr:hypothetical protein [Steroidobacteraceae bacterium]